MERLLVDARDPDSALALVDELKEFHAELLPGSGDRCEVQIDLAAGRESRVNAALAAIERWLTATGIEAAKVTLDDRTYVLERGAETSGVSAEHLEKRAGGRGSFKPKTSSLRTLTGTDTHCFGQTSRSARSPTASRSTMCWSSPAKASAEASLPASASRAG